MKTKNNALRMAAAVSLCMPAWAFAQFQGFGSEGYFRVGPGNQNQPTDSRACYGLEGAGLKYRLGNECDLYGEVLLGANFKASDVDFSFNVMPSVYNGSVGGSATTLQQLYVEAAGFGVAPGVKFWAGKRYFRRSDVHIVDTYYLNLSGVGVGAADIAAGPGKLALAYFGSDGNDEDYPELIDDDDNPITPLVRRGPRHGNRINFDYYDLPVNTNGTLRLVGTFTQSAGNNNEARNGAAFSVVHKQDKLFEKDVANSVWLQTAMGSAGLNGNFGPGEATSDVRSWRLIDSVNWQVGAFGGQAQAMYQNDRDANGRQTDSATVGGRLTYAFTNNFKLVGEAGYSQKKPEGGATQKLTKFTIAPTFSTGPGFFKRPELRIYVTRAMWNDAANEAAGPLGVTRLGDQKTSGTSFGAQLEMWW